MGIRPPHQRRAQIKILGAIFPFLFSIFLLAGCASPGEPVERRAPIPAAITDLSAQQYGNSAVLTFTMPRDTIERRLLKRAPEVEIYRGFSSIAPPAPTTPPSTPPASVAPPLDLSPVVTIPSALVGHYERGGAVRYTDAWAPEALKQHAGEFAIYMVRTSESPKKRSPDSNVASLRVYAAPDPISDLKAQLARSAVALTWTAPQQTPIGPAPPIKGYEIYRSEISSGATAAQPSVAPRVFPTPGAKKAATEREKIGTTGSDSYQDTQASLGARYEYSVRCLVDYSGQLVESADSNIATITMRDVFAPSAPAGLVVVSVPAENGRPVHLDLSWNVNPETDLAGYNVYRSGQEGTVGARLNSQLLPTPVFSDMSAVAGQRYFYQVTAVDRSGNESKPSAAVAGEIPAESQPEQ
jgi:hypothetical protein